MLACYQEYNYSLSTSLFVHISVVIKRERSKNTPTTTSQVAFSLFTKPAANGTDGRCHGWDGGSNY